MLFELFNFIKLLKQIILKEYDTRTIFEPL